MESKEDLEKKELHQAQEDDRKNREFRDRLTSERAKNPDDPDFVMPSLPDTKDIRELALAVEDDIFKTYYKLMMNNSAPPAVRKSCADALADRAKGKPEQAITKKVEVTTKDVSLEKVARMIAFSIRDSREKGLIEEEVIDVTPEKEDDE